jgi:hypothetical protein
MLPQSFARLPDLEQRFTGRVYRKASRINVLWFGKENAALAALAHLPLKIRVHVAL